MRRSGRARRPGLSLARIGRTERGAAIAAAVLFLPALLAVMAALFSLGQVVWYRHIAYQAADLGALAGVQALDLDQLAQGKLHLLTGEATARASEYAWENIVLALGPLPPGLDVQVHVINPAGADASDPITGRVIEYPTVCVVLRFPVNLRVGPVQWTQDINAHADASVVPR
ncbi:MAG: hypothetical protein Q8P31_04370 [Bacillota bacterium]|nr:hypothetical protein [Bacillota bacterium]